MQQADNQHLDFLISQYVDGTLEGTGKKSVEQKMLLDPAARALYAEHRETQDLLDDWGNRLPLINWNEFDATLATRLDEQAREQERASIFRRRMKPIAAAAALLLAASLGYGWHALSHRGTAGAVPGGMVQVPSTPDARPRTMAQYPESTSTRAEYAWSGVADQPAGFSAAPEAVVMMPENATALRSLQDSIASGLKNVSDIAPILNIPAGAVVVDQGRDEKDQQFPR
jgi:hypothetical protein